MSIYSVNYDGLKKRKSYEELINYIQYDQEQIKYPDRAATQVINSHELSNLLDSEGLSIKNLKDQHRDKSIIEMRDHIIREIAATNNGTAQVLRAQESNNVIDPEHFNIGNSTPDAGEDVVEQYDNLEEENENKKKKCV